MIDYGTARRLVGYARQAADWCDACASMCNTMVLPVFQLHPHLRPFYYAALHRHIRPAHQARVQLDAGDHVEPLPGALA